MPRDNGNELYNVIALTVTFNNLLPNLKKSLTPKSSESDESN